MPQQSKEKKRKVKKNKQIQSLDRAFYELRIIDLNQSLARIHNQIRSLDEKNKVLKEKLWKLQHNRTEVALHLRRKLADRNNTIMKLREQRHKLTRLRETKSHIHIVEERIRDLEQKHQAMHDELTAEIRELTAKLDALNELRFKHNTLMRSDSEESVQHKNRHRSRNENIYVVQTRMDVAKSSAKKQAASKVTEGPDKQPRTNYNRSARYIRRLMCEIGIGRQKSTNHLI